MQNCRHCWIACFMLMCLPVLSYCSAAVSHQEQSSRLEPHCPERCSCSRNLKQISCVGQRLRNVPNDIPLSVTKLYLSHNLLTEIRQGAFRNLTNLTDLSLEVNYIENVADGAFLGLINLKTLYFRDNQLTSLSSEVFRDLYNLSYLYLTQNKLERIPDMTYAQNLIYLTLDLNNLESASFPTGFRNLTRLSTVVLSNNPKLTQITNDDIDALSHSTVRKITVSRCSLSDFGDNVFDFPHLQSLSLSYNTGWNETVLRRVLSLLVNCSELTSLDLSGVISLPKLAADIFNSLADLPLMHLSLAHTAHIAVVDNGTFQYFPVLENLDLSYSEFSIIQDTMSKMKKLKTLNLSHNRQLPLVPQLDLPSLELLDLSHCTSLRELKQTTFLHLPLLSTLIIHDCDIRTIYKNAFCGLDHLKILDLSSNLFSSSSFPVDLFSPLSELTYLNLSNNRLEQIVTEKDLFKHLPELAVLDLSGNECCMIPEEIFNSLQSLTTLDLSRNSLGGGVISDASGGKLLHGLHTLERVMLVENNIYDLPLGFFDNLPSLQMVNLSNNHLDRWNGSSFAASANLSLIDFSANKLTAIPEQSVMSLPTNAKLNLSENPFACWCDLVWFRNWITSHNVTDQKLPGLKSYKCSSPLDMTNRPLLDFDPETITKLCKPLPWLIITASVATGVAVIIIVLVSICYRHRWRIRLKMYKMKKRMRRERDYEILDEDTANAYDVYVSYGPSAGDEKWVKETLMPVIDIKERAENPQPEDAANVIELIRDFRSVNAYWEERDMIRGTSEIGSVAEAIYKSRKIMLVISLDYLKDGRRAFEIQMAVDKSCRARLQLEDIIIVLLDRDASVRLPVELHRKMETGRELQWTADDEDGQRVFWHNLQEQLHSVIIPENI